ncbi:uncharacterized protein DFR58_10392 [Anaerobacterium chartisolvens]|uniref:Radical SAM core domain-containing protein n=1 Tax=Anaerobacterium chartisolvens TaxID=1297424 RepID=A0A369BFU5_9FIRM|nr:nif11-like peptide radical SAM maturase [Anaerobacterium chartisolvens]RCX19347.1 uncharacterized protein DFR58_10392 [Anaerobacterium chartisolvens]
MDKNNVMPFHLFTHHGIPYVINIENMQASSVDEISRQVLENIQAAPEALLTSGTEEVLKKLGLISSVDYKLKKAEKKECFPITDMTLLLTQSCNLKCVYCYGDSGKYGTGGNMEEKTAYRAVDWLIEQSERMKNIYIEFLGGEPFLIFPLMKAVAEYAKKRALEAEKKVSFRCTTNATLLEEEQIAFIKEHNISVTISFDGPKEVQDAQRPFANGKGSYDYTLPKIKKVLEALPMTPAHAVIVGNTDPKQIKDTLQEIGFKKLSIVPASNSLLTVEAGRIKAATDNENLIHELEQEAEDWITLIQSRDSEALMNLKATSGLYGALISLLNNIKRRYACGAGRGLVSVCVSGDVYLCHRFVGIDEYKLGNIFGKQLNREKYLSSPATSNEICSACFARYYCAGGCKHDNVGWSGSVSVPSKGMCRMRCRELELAASIIVRLKRDDIDFLLERQIFTPKPCLFDF